MSRSFTFPTRRRTGNVRARTAIWTNRAQTWLPALAGLWVFSILYSAAGGGWVGFAAASLLFLVGAFGALLVYWRVRLRRAKAHIPLGDVTLQLFHCWILRKNWPRACDSAALSRRRNFVAPRLGRLQVRDDGTIVTRVRNGAYGVPFESLVEESGRMAQFLGCYEMAVKDLRDAPRGRGAVSRLVSAVRAKSGISELRFFYDDPTGRLMRLSELPVSSAGTLAYGRRIDGGAAYVQQHLSLLIFGMTGYGKSNVVWTLLGDALRKRVPIRLYVSDPKAGMELRVLGEQLGRGSDYFQVAEYAMTPDATKRMVGSIEKEMVARQQRMREAGQRKHKPTVEEPLCVFLADEFLALGELIKKGADSPLGRIAYQGRAAGFVIWGLAQDPTKETVGPLRTMIPQRLALRLDNPASNVPALSVSAPCHEIDKPGVGFSFVEGESRPQRFRAPLVSDSDIELIAQGSPPEMQDDEVKGDPHVVYRYWGVLPVDDWPQFRGEEVLFYIGLTNDFARRDREHSAEKGWYQFVTRKDGSEVWPSRNRALVEEKRAIEDEDPVFNDQHNDDNPIRGRMKRLAWDDPRRDLNPFRNGKQKTGV